MRQKSGCSARKLSDTPSFSSGRIVQVEYTSVPPGLTYRAALSKIARWITGRANRSSGFLYRTSGFFRMMPKPEQGASTSTTSNRASHSGRNPRPSAAVVWMHARPSRSAPSRMRFSLFSWRSQAKISPWSSIAKAAEKDLPPGAAHTSSTRIPGSTPAIWDTSRAAGSWTRNFPIRKGSSAVRSPTWSSSRHPDTQGWGRTITPDASSSAVSSSAAAFSGFT